jgi:hypothetical protein
MTDKQDGHYIYQNLTSNSFTYPEQKIVQSDALSRRQDYGTEGQLDDKEKTMLPENLFIN